MPKIRMIDANELFIKQKSHADLFNGSDKHDDIIRRDEATMALAEIQNAPTIESEPVRRGWWIVYTTWHGMFGLIHSECSECKFDRNGDLSSWKFCPNCGARMDGGD